MARVSPPLEFLKPVSAGDYAERAILERLCNGLDDRFHVLHGVDWAISDGGVDRHGELDIVVINDAGDVALLEVKAGSLKDDGHSLRKTYGTLNKDVSAQARRQFGGVLHRFKQEGIDTRLLHWLVLPDYKVDSVGTVSYPRDRIADADDCQNLPAYVLAKLGGGQPDPERKRRVLAFFGNRQDYQPDVSAIAGRLRQQVQFQSDGLATWVPRITAPNGVIRVQGTAGSGKTQLALRLLRDAALHRRKAAYICFNRPLADQMRSHAPDATEVVTFHQLAWQAAGSPSGIQNHEAHVQALAAELANRPGDLDLLLIDELQDFTAEWVSAILPRVRDDGQLVLLDDPGQCLYPDREEIELPGSVLITCDDNHRSPRRVVEMINLLRLGDREVHARSPLAGELPDLHVYEPQSPPTRSDSLQHRTVEAVQAYLEEGLGLQDIALLVWRGREHSALLKLDRLGDWRLSKFTGAYDTKGEPVWTDGDLRVDTVRRFKGQSAPAVVVTEVDFDTLDTIRRHLLFVALTRAQMRVACVLSAAAERVLMARFV